MPSPGKHLVDISVKVEGETDLPTFFRDVIRLGTGLNQSFVDVEVHGIEHTVDCLMSVEWAVSEFVGLFHGHAFGAEEPHLRYRWKSVEQGIAAAHLSSQLYGRIVTFELGGMVYDVLPGEKLRDSLERLRA